MMNPSSLLSLYQPEKNNFQRRVKSWKLLLFNIVPGKIKFAIEEIKSGSYFKSRKISRESGCFHYEKELSHANLLEKAAIKYPDSDFILYNNSSITFSQMNASANKLAHSMLQAGANPGEGMAIIMSNRTEFLYPFYACQKLGLFCVPVNPDTDPREIAQILRKTNVSWIFSESEYNELLNQLIQEINPYTKLVMAPDERENKREIPEGSIDLIDLINTSSNTSNPKISFNKSLPMLILFTSGTTGKPKGVVLRYEHSHVRKHGLISKLFLSRKDTLYNCLPLHHAEGIFCVCVCAAERGIPVGIGKIFSPRRFWYDVGLFKATFCCSTGEMITDLLKHPKSINDKNNSLKYIMATDITVEGWTEFESRFRIGLIHKYFAVDGAGGFIINYFQSPVGSIGKPLPGFRYDVKSLSLTAIKNENVGELVYWLNGNSKTAIEYLDNVDLPATESWLPTNDIVYRDDKGNFYFLGRKNEIMTINGIQLSAFEIEKRIKTLDQVKECAIIGINDNKSSAFVHLYVVPVEQMNFDIEEFITELMDRLPDLAMPRFINVKTNLPKTPTQRIDKNKLVKAGIQKDTIDLFNENWYMNLKNLHIEKMPVSAL